ncbi:helix-turn-helix domain-containing protein [Algoriphagus sp.]|uniref:helix-turn-helix domain-containing protein n=1 Tax=Algoriphagus sp. TaxID=1872435 RepID=UPI0035251423
MNLLELEKRQTLPVKQKLGLASKRIYSAFMELLERQFPIIDKGSSLKLRSPSDFAEQLNIHVNHLNRAIKYANGKTTSFMIKNRILQESKRLLTISMWKISEIAYALGFSEVTHFNNFFKNHTKMTPTQFRTSEKKKDRISVK